MKYLYLVDVCLGVIVERGISKPLPQYSFKFVRNINPKMQDTEILNLANEEDRVIITSDKDFGELVFRNKKEQRAIVFTQLLFFY